MVDTSGEFSCGNERYYWGSRTVGASCGVTVRDSPCNGSAAYIGALVPCQGVAWVQKRSDAF